jgi:hypothetical protein
VIEIDLKERVASLIWENAASNIWKDIADWDGADRPTAILKWPWELLQNATDAAIEAEKRGLGCQSLLNVEFAQTADGFVFRHDGARGTFNQDDIIQLVLRGSGKSDVDRETGEGRFGEGFLATHVLSRRVRVDGWVQDTAQARPFSFVLDRSGEKQDIQRGIDAVFEYFGAFDPAHGITEGWAEFRYLYPPGESGSQAVGDGLWSQRHVIPFCQAILHARHGLCTDIGIMTNSGRIRMAVDKTGCRQITPNTRQVAISVHEFDGQQPRVRHLLVHDTAWPLHYLVVPYDPKRKCICAIEEPEEVRVPRLFTNFPLVDTSDLPVPYVISGRHRHGKQEVGWAVGSRRLDINYRDSETSRAVEGVIQNVPQLFSTLADDGCTNTHKLLAMGKVQHKGDSGWWNVVLSGLAQKLRDLPAVRCATQESRLMPPSAVEFPSAVDVCTDTAQLEAVWAVARLAGRTVPIRDLAADWLDIALAWGDLGVDIAPCTLKDLLSAISIHGSLADMVADKGGFPAVASEARAKEVLLAALRAVTSQVRTTNKVDDYITQARIYCTQGGRLCIIREKLAIDNGITGTPKQIARLVGADLSEILLAEEQSAPEFRDWFVDRHEWPTWGDAEAIGHIASSLRRTAGMLSGREGQAQVREGLVAFLRYGFKHWGDKKVRDAVGDWREIPIVLAEEQEIATLVQKQLDRVLPPTTLLDLSLRQNASSLPGNLRIDDSVLDDLSLDEYGAFAEFLVDCGIASKDGFYTKTMDLDTSAIKLLSPTVPDSHSLKGVQVKGFVGMDRMLNALRGLTDTAEYNTRTREFLKLLIECVATRDESWRETIRVVAPCGIHKRSCAVDMNASEWLLRLLGTPWVKTGESGPELPGDNLRAFVASNPGLLKEDEAIELLVRLGCDRLALQVIKISDGDPARERSAKDLLAGIAEQAGSTQELREIGNLLAERAQRVQRVASNKAIGQLVERIIVMEARARRLDIPDKPIENLPGHDFEARGMEVVDDEDDVHIILPFPQPVWVEVKKASTDEVRLTMPQATASVQRGPIGHALCVMDFRKEPDLHSDVMEAAQCIARGELNVDDAKQRFQGRLVDLIKFSSVGEAVRPQKDKYDNLARADEDAEVRVEPGNTPRFAVSCSLWSDQSVSLVGWIEKLRLLFSPRVDQPS